MFLKSSIPVQNGSIQVFSDRGLFKQTDAIQEYVIFEAEQVNQNQTRTFKSDGGTYLPLTAFGAGSSYSLTYQIKRNGSVMFSASYTAANLNAGQVLPGFIITPDSELSIINASATTNIPWIIIIAKEVSISHTFIGVA